MGCNHKSVTSSSTLKDMNDLNELFYIKCNECRSIIHEDLTYDEFIDICKKNEYIVTLEQK